MKKIISILMAVAMSLMVMTTVAFAEETAVIKIEPYAIPAEEIDEYGAVDGYDAYLLNVYISGVDANRTNTNTVTGRVMAAFELTFTAEKSDIIDWENSYVYEPASGVELVKGVKSFQIKSGEPTRTASFPAKGQTVAADEETLYAAVLIYIPEGESLAFDVKDLSFVFSTYASGSIEDASLTKVYDTRSTENPITCDTTSLSLGEVKEETKTVGCLASMIYNSKFTGIEFTVTTDDVNATINPATKKVPFANLTSVESGSTTVTVGLNINGVPKTANVTATAKAY